MPVVVVTLRAVTLMPVTPVPVIAFDGARAHVDAVDDDVVGQRQRAAERRRIRGVAGDDENSDPTLSVAPAPMSCWLVSIVYAAGGRTGALRDVDEVARR